MSAYTHQLVDCRESTLKNISGVCASSQAFVDLVNEAQRRLMRRGNWFGTTWLARVCVHGCNIAWPRQFGTILGVRQCGGVMDIQNNWFSFISPQSTSTFGGNYGGYAGYGGSYLGGYGSYGGGAWGGRTTNAGVVLADENEGPTFNRVSGHLGKLIRYHVVKRNDIGKKLTLFGTKYGEQPLQEYIAGHWQNGLTLTAADLAFSSQVRVTNISSITREATEGWAYLYEWEPTSTPATSITVSGMGESTGISPPPTPNDTYTLTAGNYVQDHGPRVIQQDTDGTWFMWLGVVGNVVCRSVNTDLYGVWNSGAIPPAPIVTPTDPLYGWFNNLAVFEPNEVRPRYRRSRISNYCNVWGKKQLDENGSPIGVCNKQIEVLTKLAFVPVVNDRDFLLVDNFDALKMMIQSLKLEEANDFQNAAAFELKAIHEMNMEDRDKMPQNNTPVAVNSTMSVYPLCNPI